MSKHAVREPGPQDAQRVAETALVMARAEGIDPASLATLAGVPVEKIQSTKVDWATARALARAVHLDLVVLSVPPAPSARSSLADPRLGLAWSNPNAPTRALIARAIERGEFSLILRAAREHGIAEVASVLQQMRAENEFPERSLSFADRALRNIALGAARALHAGSH